MVRERNLQATAPLLTTVGFKTSLIVIIVLIEIISLNGGLNAQENSRGSSSRRRPSSCYDLNGKPQRCMPEFVNAAFNLPVHATNTCGNPRIRYCRQTGVTGAKQSCAYCDASDPRLEHPPRLLTDYNNNDNQTWWQSQTMYERIQYPESVNLTLRLGKSYDITYVRIKFHSPRPESFAIYKRTTEGSDWVPYQYYSGSCQETYELPTDGLITRDDEKKAVCSADYSDISPLTGGNVAFSTLEGRPSAYTFESSQALQDWVTATEIKIVLNRLNTFGDEVFADKTVLQSYYYGISDISIGGRCKCNGHSSECVESTGQGQVARLVCRCEHNTQGPDCNECQPFYNDRPWARATAASANECQPCNCNGLSLQCYFDEELFQQTGHGGHCMNCQDNTDGANCENCKENFYRRAQDQRCVACNCDPTGSQRLQCDIYGQCTCKSGVTGEKCDQCQSNHYDFGPNGCRPCACVVAGSLDNDPRCLANTGICSCKEFVEGQNCDKCKPGYFGLEKSDPYGCISCFCFGHSSVCSSAPGYQERVIESVFNSNSQRVSAVDQDGNTTPIQYDPNNQNIIVSTPNADPVYFTLPTRYLGDQRFSYNQYLTFTLRISGDDARASRTDIILEGANQKISTPIFSQRNNMPRDFVQEFKFRLNEHPDYQWTPRLAATEFIGVLSNLTAIKIRATYTNQGSGILDDLKLQSAARSTNGGEEASWIEQCTCPEGYVGQFCESCAAGYRRDPPYGGPYARCIPCNCNGHSQSCDVNSGRCICQHHTTGDNCERCAPGYYGYAMKGTPDDCQKCPCPDGGSCVELLTGDIACINCKAGYSGLRCDFCADGFYGDPEGKYGAPRPCEECLCNSNIDKNAVANCNSTSGECLKCIYNTAGSDCGECLPGYFGDPIALPKGQCRACNCYGPGSHGTVGEAVIQCDRKTGQCPCRPNVVNRKCDKPAEGFFDIDSRKGGQPCNCDPVGSYNASCHEITGQCPCKPGVDGRTCDTCLSTYYGFGSEGCFACNCDSEGSVDLQCDESGQCPCKPSVVGRSCDVCEENKFNITAGCIGCPACYTLIKDRVDRHRVKLYELRDLIANIGSNPTAVNDTDFKYRLDQVALLVDQLLEDARKAIGIDGPMAEQLEEVKKAVKEIQEKTNSITKKSGETGGNAKVSMDDIMNAKLTLDRTEKILEDAENYIEKDGKDALRKAKEAQKKLGQQSIRMTEIAKIARETSEQQKSDSESIENVAKEAVNTSNEAYRIAREAMQSPMTSADKLEELRKNVTGAESLYNHTLQTAEQAKKKASDTLKDTVDTYTKANSLTLPEVDPENLIEESKAIEEEAKQIQTASDKLMEQNEDLLKDVSTQMVDARDLLDKGRLQQQIADELLADADIARATARDAVDLGEKTLKDANQTLKTLREFDQKVQQSKAKAEEALKEIPAIERQIALAEQKTVEAQDALKGAESDANEARDIAKEAQKLAEMASQEAGKIQTNAGDAKERAQKQKDKATKLSTDVDKARQRLGEMEIQADDDEKIIRQALLKADEAKNSATDSSKKVKKALNTVNKILDDLEQLEMVDTERLENLEKKLADAENALRKTEFGQRYDQLVAGQNEQQHWIDRYLDDLEQLRKDVANVEAIKNSLPDGCFKTTNIEVP
ncbi:laminin subunit gamma-1-like [Tubulanus polymorphus]|uniref:laminin subunit gamma-1-like n=1 Tax=Tubulanus polymorphus TaxID=672921 RepID=UPI003DA24BF3